MACIAVSVLSFFSGILTWNFIRRFFENFRRAQYDPSDPGFSKNLISSFRRERLMLIGEMMAGVVHDLNNSITSIIGFSELLGDTSNMEEIKKYTSTLHLESQRCRKIVSSLLRFSRQDEGVKQECLVNELIGNVFDLKVSAMRQKKIRLELNLDETIPPLFCDPVEIQQVFFNLIQNAEEAMRDQSQPKLLKVTSRRAGDKILICFQDSGPGAPREIQGETGLGICREIIKSHQGQFYLSNDSGSGVGFVIELPCAATSPEAEKKTGLEGMRVVILDDEKPLVRFCQTALLKRGCRVEGFSTVDDALQYLEGHDFDAMLLDYRMGRGKSSSVVFDYLVSRKPRLVSNVILTSGDVYDPLLKEKIQHGRNSFLPKPFRAEEMIAAILKVAENKKT